MIPKNGFKSWKALDKFYCNELKLEEIYRGDSAEKLKNNLNEILWQINYLEFILANGIDTVKEDCLKLKNEIRLDAEVINKRVQDVIDELTEKLSIYEAKCISNLEWDKANKEKFDEFSKS